MVPVFVGYCSMMRSSSLKIFLTGRPGVGKTTVVRRIVDRMGYEAAGFYTEEIRTRGKREGFLIQTLEGESGVLAHVSHGGPFRVGRYGVDVERFDRLAVSCLERALGTDAIVVIDEIGKMELFSERFRELVERILISRQTVLAVVHQGNDSFARKIRGLPGVEEWVVAEKNRDDLPTLILDRIEARY
jgi:nucleoside-triphosphatase